MPFITLEGIEGCGKSTQARRLADDLGPAAVLTREPGATGLGQGIRTLLLEQRRCSVGAVAELFLYFADRAQHVEQVIRPALAAGRTVISDRYVDSTLAYQGYGRGIRRAQILALAEVATGGLWPDLTILLDLPAEVGLARVAARGGHDRIESEVMEFHERVRSGYLEMAALEPGRWALVDGQGSPDDVAARVRQVVELRRGAEAHGLR